MALAGGTSGDFVIAGDACSGRSIGFGETCSVGLAFRPRATGNRQTNLRVTDTGPGSPRAIRLRGTGGLLSLRLEPEIGPRGSVTRAIGEGFPAGAQVTLHWEPGLDSNAPPVVVGPDGRFEISLLLYRNDAVGARRLVATSAGGPAFPEQEGTFLVVPGTQQPPSSGAVGLLGPGPRPLVLRH